MKRLLFLHIFLLFAVLAWAQNPVATAFPYECSFEEDEDLSAWTLNYGTPNATDKWMYGYVTHSTGRRALYASADGINPSYGQNKNITVAFLRYRFPDHTATPNASQKYDVSFDWKGEGDSTTSRLFVMYGFESEFFPTGTSSSGKVLENIINAPFYVLSDTKQIPACTSLGDYDEKYICGSEVWQNVSFSREVSVSGANSAKTFMFVFIWQNINTSDTTRRSSISIDNFQINSALVKKPQDLVVYPQCEDSSMLVTWNGMNAATFDIQYRKTGELNWTHTFGDLSLDNEGFERVPGTTTNYTYTLRPVLEGSYDVRIRGKNDGLITSYVYYPNIFVYCPDNHCINYVNLHDSTKVTCTYGYYPGHLGEDPYTHIGIIDYGPEEEASRHTLHVDPTETDPRTGNMLKTVPDGALASVRLGNWNDGYEAESITYDIQVDSANQGILIVKYAVVLEEPGHDEEPEFKMEVLDGNGQLIDASCGYAKFTYSDAVGSGWNTYEYSASGSSWTSTVAWKDWTTVGVNLQPYHGQNIKVRFTTMDCNAGGHFGYAYFTVDCANAHIETENCGNSPYVECMAPDGFAYYWYKNDDPNQPAEGDPYQQTLIVNATRTKYTCRVSFIEQPDCYFEISTTSEPRFPVPEYTVENVSANCRSAIKFNNTSHVMNKFDGVENHTTERVNAARWSFRSLVTGQTTETTAWSPTYYAWDYGDTIEVTYTAYIGADNSCDSARVDTFITPNIVSKPSEIHIKTCYSDPIEFAGQYYNTSDTVTVRYTNFAGCDSLSTLYLTVYPKPADTYRHDSICSNQSVSVGGKYYNQPMENELIMLKDVHGCDSAVYLTLTVNQLLQATIDSLPYACADEQQMYILFDIAAGVYDSLEITFNTPQLRDTVIYDQVTSVAIPYDENVVPGHYMAMMRFYQFCCGTFTRTRGFDIRYRSSIVEQKWNDVLTLLSPKYNGGYEFTAYQWYKNDVPLEGETHSYLYQPLDFDAQYYVEVVRKDGVVMKTCPIQPIYHEQQSDYPTVVKAAQRLPVYMEHSATIWYYTVSGQLYSSFTLPQGHADLPTPEQTGIFVLKAVDAQGESKAQVMIVQ